jgi:TonB family protein
MTLWLSNLAAYSLQLAALVGSAVVIATVLKVFTPAAALRFWQVVFAATLLWPAAQIGVLAWPDAVSNTFLARALANGPLWSAAVSPGELRASLFSLDGGTAMLVLAALAAGVAVRLAYLGLGLSRLRAIRATSAAADELSTVVADLQRELAVDADVRFSDAVDAPATLGWRRPVVLLPRSVRALAPPLLRAVLCHELIHVRRRDWLASLLEEFWCGLLWFHPAARVLTAQLSLARETLVDEAAMAHTGDRRSYAAALLAFAGARVQPPIATTLIGRRSLERRIALIAREVPMPVFPLVSRVAAAACVVLCATLVTTWAVPISTTLQAQPNKVYKPKEDKAVTLPEVVRETKPQYTPQAMKAKIQGTVWLTVIVLDTGNVGDVTVAKSLDAEHGLDDEAVKAARQWVFKPGTRDGKPVNVEVTIEMTFTLKK